MNRSISGFLNGFILVFLVFVSISPNLWSAGAKEEEN